MNGRRLALVGVGVLLLLVCFPDAALAWTPGTHIFLGESVLTNLTQLPAPVQDLLRLYPFDFLYGNIAADTSIAKKYAPVGRHCHSWNVGFEIHDRADTEPLRAFSLGYLAHLAADTVAHNFFVPHQLVVASRTVALGHSYWESRFETHLGDPYAKTAMDVIRFDHSAADAHLDRILAPTIFSVRTSRRLFRGMVGITETESWQAAFRTIAEKSRWDLTDESVEAQMQVSFQLVMELLSEGGGRARKLDPSGEVSLGLAKRLRTDVARARLPDDRAHLQSMAAEHFGLPSYETPFWEGSAAHRPWKNGR